MERLLSSYRAIPSNATVRLSKRTSNLFRKRAKSSAKGLDTSGLTGVLSVDPDARTADVAGMCTYEDLVAATLPYGLSPLVVPQLKTITLGGAVTGLGIESTSFRNGLPHESVLEMDILTGDGEVVTASPEVHADLFRAFPNSYGTLGYSVRVKIELEPVKPFVTLRHLRFDSLTDLVANMDRIIETGGYDGTSVDYLDGVVFSADESYLCLGIKTSTPGPVSDYTGQQIYYRSIQHAGGEKHDRLTIHDYLWRWDTDWFWCSRALGVQHPAVRRLCPAPAQALAAASTWKAVIGYRAAGTASRPGSRSETGGAGPRARGGRPGHRGAHRTDGGLPSLVPGKRSDRTDLAMPAPTARRARVNRRLAAVPDPTASHLRQRRLLVVGPGRRYRG